MLVALSAQRYPLPFQNFLHTRQARSDHRVVQRFADHARQVQPQLSPRGFPSILALGTLVHGGLLLLPNPIFRSGEECRHSNLNNLQDIAPVSPLPRLLPCRRCPPLEPALGGSLWPLRKSYPGVPPRWSRAPMWIRRSEVKEGSSRRKLAHNLTRRRPHSQLVAVKSGCQTAPQLQKPLVIPAGVEPAFPT